MKVRAVPKLFLVFFLEIVLKQIVKKTLKIGHQPISGKSVKAILENLPITKKSVKNVLCGENQSVKMSVKAI